jgi:hypothetical protein
MLKTFVLKVKFYDELHVSLLNDRKENFDGSNGDWFKLMRLAELYFITTN